MYVICALRTLHLCTTRRRTARLILCALRRLKQDGWPLGALGKEFEGLWVAFATDNEAHAEHARHLVVTGQSESLLKAEALRDALA